MGTCNSYQVVQEIIDKYKRSNAKNSDTTEQKVR